MACPGLEREDVGREWIISENREKYDKQKGKN